MDIKYLDTFMKVTELKSFTLAAERLGISQPGVSKQIQRLEAELGTALFRRHENELSLTDAGRTVYQSAQSLVAQWITLQGRCQEYAGLLTGELKIGSSSIPGKHYLPGLLLSFHQLHPGVEVTVLVKDSQEILNAVETGDIDLAFLGSKPTIPDLASLRIGSDKLVVVGAKAMNSSENDWRLRSFIMREAGSGTRRAAEDALRNMGILPEGLSCCLQTSDSGLILQMVERGMGLAVLSSLDAAEAVLQGSVHVLQELPTERHFYLAYKRNREQSAVQQAFMDIVYSKLEGTT